MQVGFDKNSTMLTFQYISFEEIKFIILTKMQVVYEKLSFLEE